VPGNVTQPAGFAPNPLIKQRRAARDQRQRRHRRTPHPIRGGLVVPSSLRGASLNSSEKKIYDLLTVDNPTPIDDVVEGFALDSFHVLATRFDLEMKGGIRQLPGKQFCKVLLCHCKVLKINTLCVNKQQH
jgi:hypothetical protein